MKIFVQTYKKGTTIDIYKDKLTYNNGKLEKPKELQHEIHDIL